MKRMLCWLVFLTIAMGFGLPANGVGLILVEDASWWPGPVPPRPFPPPWPTPPRPFPQPHPFAPLEVSSVQVRTRISDQVAVTTVDQDFYNPNSARLEGTFVFPIPKGGHLDKFTMEIDGKKVQAELLPADKARRIYEDIVRKLKDPALLEYGDRDIFKVRIFPIEPNSHKRITLVYSELLKSDAGLVGYRLPLSTQKFSARPLKNVSVKVELEAKRPLKTIYSPSHAVEIKRDGPNRAVAGYEAGDVLPDQDFALYFAPEKDDLGVNLLTFRKGGEDGYFLLLASPGVDLKERQVIPKDVVFVLDTSGSMAGKKLDQAKKALQFCVENLNDTDRFEIIRFSTEVEPLFEKLVDAGKGNRGKAQEFIKDLKPMGGTAIDEALKKAIALKPSGDDPKGRVFVVIFLTDGRPTIGTTDENEILGTVKRETAGHCRVFCFGIGTDVNTHLLDRITEQTRAFSQYVLPEEDLEVKVSSFFSKIKEPVLANPIVKFTGEVRATKMYPAPLPDLFKGEQLVLAGRYSGKGDSAVIVEGSVNGALRKFTYEVRFPEEATDNEFIPRLWATRRVGYLLDEIRLHGENTELRDEVTELARKYSIVTPYTAYLILEDEAHRNVPVAMRSLQDFGGDREAQREASANWERFKDARGGEVAVAGARYGLALKSAMAPAAAAADSAKESQRALGLIGGSGGMNRPEDGKQRLAQYSQQAQFVNGKTFFQNQTQWLDSALQQNQNAKRLRIQFASKEYFDLAAKDPMTLPWLALGQNVQFVHNGTMYDIYE